MASLLQLFNNLYDTFWSEKFWLGDDARWSDFISDDPNIYYPKISHMNWSIVVGAILVLVRDVWER